MSAAERRAVFPSDASPACAKAAAGRQDAAVGSRFLTGDNGGNRELPFSSILSVSSCKVFGLSGST